jgi:hypothetical protein
MDKAKHELSNDHKCDEIRNIQNKNSYKPRKKTKTQSWKRPDLF